jgi:hypothetical protein
MRAFRLWSAIAVGLIVLVVGVGLFWRDDILQALLDPELPYAVYKPPPSPDYASPDAWAMRPGPLRPFDPPADVFFIHPTTFDGGRHWNGPIDDHAASRLLTRVMLPNYAGPFATAGRVFAPRYRQASLYTSLTLFDDAIEAREFAYGDVLRAFRSFLAGLPAGRPFIVVGVEQGGILASRLVREEVEPDPALRQRLIAAYYIETAVAADTFGPGAAPPPCASPLETGCVVAWISARWLDFGRLRRIMNRGVIWNERDHLVGLAGRRPLCVNPLLGEVGDAAAPARLNRGAANASGLEWGAEPGFLSRQVGAQCVDGILRVTTPRSSSLRPSGGWARRLRAAPYNLFWADLKADAKAREDEWLARHVSGAMVGQMAPPDRRSR